MPSENKWPASRKRAAVIFAAMMVFYFYLLYSGKTNFIEDLRDYLKLGLPIFVLYIVSKRIKEKKKRQDKQEVGTGKEFLEKHDVKSSD